MHREILSEARESLVLSDAGSASNVEAPRGQLTRVEAGCGGNLGQQAGQLGREAPLVGAAARLSTGVRPFSPPARDPAGDRLDNEHCRALPRATDDLRQQLTTLLS